MNILQYIILFLALMIATLGALVFFDIIPAPRTLFGMKYTTTKEEGMGNMSEYQRIQLQETREYKYLQYRGTYLKNCQKLDKDGEYEDYYDEVIGDDFENLYKGEISKSGVPILPSKRARKVPEKIQVSQDDLAELKNSPKEQTIESEPANESADAEGEDVSLDNLKDEEIANTEQEDSESTNS